MERHSKAIPITETESLTQRRRSVVMGLVLSMMLGLAAMLALSQAVQAQVLPDPPITIAKRVSNDTGVVSETVTYSITVENSYTETQTISMSDPLPQGVEYVGDGEPSASLGQAHFLRANRVVQWEGTLKPGEKAVIGFVVIIIDPIDVVKRCGHANFPDVPDPITNEARATSNLFPDAIFPGQVVIKHICPDLGDAPDSTNHSIGITMTAYSGPIIARYPTVFDPATGLPQGPRHAFPKADAWLGPNVSGERDADLLPDQDGVRNITPPTNTPDKDGKDDGVLTLPVKKNCAMTTMNVQVNVVGGLKNRFLNVWIDWNRDGDWDDIYTACPGLAAGDWVVQDFVTNLPNGLHTVTVPAFVALDSSNIPDDHWMRVTLSDASAPKDSTTLRADGRGPPHGFKFGETEDYIVRLIPPVEEPHLAMSKTANVTQVGPGGQIEYTIIISNTGSGPANAVNWQDSIPLGTTYVAGSLNATSPTPDDSNPALMKWTGNIAAGGSVTIKFKVQVNQPIDCGVVIKNVASIMGAAGPILNAEALVKVVCEPHLEIRKIANVTQTVPGGVIEYTIQVLNTGTGPAVGVNVQDPIPAGTSYVLGSLNATLPTPDDSNPTLMKWLGNIPAGGNVVIKFKVKVNPDLPCPNKITNIVKLLGPNGQVIGTAEASVTVLCPGGEPKLTIRKTANVTQTTIGGVIEFTIVVQNSGTGPAIGLTVLDPVPAGTTYVAGSLNATAPTTDDSNPAQMKWTGNVPAGGNVVIKFKVTVNSDFQCPGKVNNVVKLFGPNNQQLGVAEASVAVLCPQGEPKLDIRKTANVSQTLPGGVIEFTIYVQNSGTAPAIGVTVQDPIPAGTTYVAGSLNATSPTTDDSNPALMKWTGNIPAGGNVVIKFKVMVNKDFPCPGKVNNVAKLLFNGAVQNSNEASVAVLCPQGEPKLTIRKSANVTQTMPGGMIEYTIVVQNSGTGPAIGVTVIDPIPAFTSYVAGSLNATAPTTDDSNPAVMKWSGNIPAGGSVTIKFKVMVSPDFHCPGKVYNAARLLNSAGQVIAGAEAVVEVHCPNGEPKLTIRKSANVTQTTPGGEIEYTITVQNSGSVPAIGVTVIDPIPAFTSYVPGSLTATAITTNDSNPALMQWVGTVPAGGTVTIKFKVKVSLDVTCPSKILNVARMLGPTGQLLGAAEALVGIICGQQGDPHITLTKSVLVEGSQQPTTADVIVPGTTAVYYLTLSSSDALSHTAHISDIIPSGLVAVAVSSSSGVANIVDSGHGVIWDGILGPGTSPVTIKILVRVEEKLECDQRMVNIAKWFVRGLNGASNEVVLYFSCRDLGDAPDSTNNAGVKMSAYPVALPGVQANYPTVFSVAAPERGPRHEFPRPFFLGKGVTPEVEADLGFDADGINNIVPTADKANLDKADDGLNLGSVNFKHCEVSKIEVVVTISPLALALLPDKVGYLNVWVDSNRDGDWADRFECPTTAGVVGTAVEHIVIDNVVDVSTLGAGVHVLSIPTSGLVFWPADQLKNPAWLRVTLSEKKSNKPLDAGTRGDGRGYNDPFRLGETEDYLLRGQETQANGDPTVSKHGEIWPDFDPATQQRRWMVGWVINYANGGTAPANNVHVVDSYDPPQTLVAQHSIPLVPHTHVTPTLDYNVGTLPIGGSGLVIIRTEVPWNTTPGTVITNTVVVNSSNDGNPLNNTGVATVTVPILPPVITGPLAGSTCTGTVTVMGVAQPGVSINLYLDGNAVPVAILTTDGAGNWSTTLTLGNGYHDLYAKAVLGTLTSDPSPTVTILVDTTLFWDPISLRFVDDFGHTIIPSGRLDESGWSIFLRPGHTYTVSLRVCCEDSQAQVTMEIGSISLTLSDPEGDHIYTGTFTVPATGRFAGAVKICVTCSLIRRCSDGQVTIDPEGTVFDLLTGLPINSANVACLQAGVSAASGEQVFSLWPAEEFDQINPQTVGVDGYFSFFTPQGTYRLDVSKSGYQPYVSPDLTVVDAPVHFDVPLTPLIAEVADQQISVSAGGFEPAVVTVEPGAVIEWINSGSEVHSSTSITPAVVFEGLNAAAINAVTGAWDSGLLQSGESYKRQLNAEGTYTYQDASDPNNTATIIVKKAEANNRVFLPVVSR